MNRNVKIWYISEFPNDAEMGVTLNNLTTFQDVCHCLLTRGDVYLCIGGDADTIVRERVFKKLAEILKRSYTFVYNLWLNID